MSPSAQGRPPLTHRLSSCLRLSIGHAGIWHSGLPFIALTQFDIQVKCIQLKVTATVQLVHLVANNPKPSQMTLDVSLLVGWHHSHHHRHLLLVLSLKAFIHHTITWKVKDWVDLGTALKVCSCAQGCTGTSQKHCSCHNAASCGKTWSWDFWHLSQMH